MIERHDVAWHRWFGYTLADKAGGVRGPARWNGGSLG